MAPLRPWGRREFVALLGSGCSVVSYGLGRVAASPWNAALFDSRRSALAEGDALPALVPSLTGALNFAVNGSVLLADTLIGGLKTSNVDNGATGSGTNYLTCNALAALFAPGSSWTVRIRCASAMFADAILWAAGNSGTSTNNYLKLFWSSLGTLVLQSATTAGGFIQRTATIDLQKNPHTIDLVCNGSTYTLLVDGAVVPFDNAAADPSAVVFDRFAISAFVSTAAGLRATTWLQYFGVATSALQTAYLAASAVDLAAADFTRALAASPQLGWFGDSITAADYLDGGFRRMLIKRFLLPNGLSIFCPGQNALGVVPNRQCYAQGGAPLLTIAQLFATNIGSSSPRLGWFMGGTNNMTQPPAQAQSEYNTAYNSIVATGTAANPAFELIPTTITPFDPTALPQATNQPIFNAWLPSYWAGKGVTPFDAAAAIGAWSAGKFVDNTHPNEAGDTLIVDAFIAQFGIKLRSISPTLNALAALITTASASVVRGVAVPLAAVVTRYPCSVEWFDGAASLGSATMGGQNGKNATLNWATGAAALGPHTIRAVVTDLLSGTTATSGPITITLTP